MYFTPNVIPVLNVFSSLQNNLIVVVHSACEGLVSPFEANRNLDVIFE